MSITNHLGTIFLWIYFPSINGAFVEGSARRRAIVNTYYALSASCITSFSLTVLQSRGHNSYNMVSIKDILEFYCV